MNKEIILEELKKTIKSYPDFPKKGIIFRDFLPILQNPSLFDKMLCLIQKLLQDDSISIDCVVGLDSRGFLFGPALSLKLNVPFVPIRKAGKLPGDVKKESYSLEYGADCMEIQNDSIKKDQKVLIVDDLIATGGTMAAAIKLVEGLGAKVEQCIVVIELAELDARKKISAPLQSLCVF